MTTPSPTDSHSPSRPASASAAYGVAAPAHRLPAAARPGGVRLQVSDLDRSLAFYQQVLGFRLLGRDAHTAQLGAEGDSAPLVELVERRGARPVPPRGRYGLYHFAILLPDRAALGRFVRHLADVHLRVGAADHLVSEALYLHDPDGLGIEVYVDRPQAEWRARDTARGRELIMSTDPLDLAGLAAAAGDTPWTGMPAGTTVGHVHLHVGDLAEAAAFYHHLLGLDAMVWSYPGALFLAAGGYHHHLGLNTWAGPGAAAPAEDEARLIEWRLLVPDAGDVEAAARSLESSGHAVAREEDGTWVVRDPWGTALRVARGA